MPIDFETSTDLDLVIGRWSGQVTIYDIVENLHRYVSDVHYRVGRPELNDLSRVEELDLNFDAMRGVIRRVELVEPERHNQTYAAIWAPGDTAFSAARMYQQLVDSQGGRAPDIYRDEREAIAAHGLDFNNFKDLRAAHVFHPQTRAPRAGMSRGA